jgi:hypothetical protein
MHAAVEQRVQAKAFGNLFFFVDVSHWSFLFLLRW